MQQFQGRTAFFTGASSGIGRCLAIELAKAGCDLCLVDVNAEGLKTLAAELVPSGVRVLLFPCNLTDRKAVSASDRGGTGTKQAESICSSTMPALPTTDQPTR